MTNIALQCSLYMQNSEHSGQHSSRDKPPLPVTLHLLLQCMPWLVKQKLLSTLDLVLLCPVGTTAGSRGASLTVLAAASVVAK